MTAEPKKQKKPRRKRAPSRPRLSLVRVRRGLPEESLPRDASGYYSPEPGGVYVHLGVVRQKPALCVVMKLDTGVLGVHAMSLFELVPKEEAP